MPTAGITTTKAGISFGIGSVAFIVALIIFLYTARVRPYTGAFNAADYIRSLRDDDVVDDETFYDMRVAELAASTEANGAQNDVVAQGLFIGSIFLITGICLNLFYVATLLFAR